jgi:peptidyl-prolyl cis-trans isomerase SurA
LNKNKIISLIIFLLIFSIKLFSQQQEGDRLLAIIGNDIITESDLQQQLGVFMRQNNISQYNDKLIQQIFQNMVAEKLMLAKGEQDSISATDEEVQKQLDYKIKGMVEQFGSEKNLEQEYGLTMVKIKEILKDDIKKKIIIDKVKQNKFGTGLKVTSSEVKNFFEQLGDSLPKMPETYELYQIAISPKLTEEEKQVAYSQAKSILDSIKAGADFSEMAIKYSQDSASAIRGGDLGKVKRGVFVKEFEDAAYLLKPGEITDVVETQFGYHIIKLVSKSGDLIETKHILIKFPKSQSADFQAINQLKDIRTKILNGEKTFQQMAMLYSQDKNSLKDSGYVGKVPLTSLDSLQIMAIRNLKQGEISDPVRIGDAENYSYTIFFVKDKIPEHVLTLEDDYKIIENYAMNYKENKEMGQWLEELKKSIYVDIKI